MSECWCQKRSSQSWTPPLVVELTHPSSALAVASSRLILDLCPAGIFFFFFLNYRWQSDAGGGGGCAQTAELERRGVAWKFQFESQSGDIFCFVFQRESLQRREWRRQELRSVSVGCLCGLFFCFFLLLSQAFNALKWRLLVVNITWRKLKKRLSNLPSFSDNKQHAKPSPVCKHAD